MNEKTALLPTAPQDFVANADVGGNQESPIAVLVTGGASTAPGLAQHQAPQDSIRMPKLVIVPGLEFDPARRYRYGMHSLAAAIMLLASFIIVESRDCNWSPGIDLDRLQGLHISLMALAFILYLLSLFGIADFIFKYRFCFLAGALLVYTIVALMVWTTYEAAVNPCKKSTSNIPIDFSFKTNKNVFNSGDAYGIIVLFLDILATVFMFSAAANFWKRY